MGDECHRAFAHSNHEKEVGFENRKKHAGLQSKTGKQLLEAAS